MTGIPQSDSPLPLNTSYTISADIEVPAGRVEGMILTSGGHFGGYGFYLLKGNPVFLWNLVDLDWQLVSAPAFLVLLLLLLATQPLMPAPLWRAIILTLVGLGIVIATIVIEATQRSPWPWVRESKPIDHAPRPALHFTLAATVLLTGLALSLLGALGARAYLLRGAHQPAAANRSH